MRGLICSIYKSRHNSDMNAASHGHDVMLAGTGPFDTEKTDLPVVKIVRRQIGGREYIHAEPVAKCPPGMAGWMMGGNFIYTSDSRFPHDYPIALHDRCEAYITNGGSI